MTIRRLRNKFSSQAPQNDSSQAQGNASLGNESSQAKQGKRFAFRRSLIETLESRQLMAVGPRLIGVQPNNSDLIENGVIRQIAPKELTFRFDDAQILDAATVGGIRVSRAGGDGSFGLPSVSSDFGTVGAVDLQLTSRNASDVLTIQVSASNLGPSVGPSFSVSGNVVNIVLNSNPTALVTAQGLVDAINASSVVSPRMSAKINGGLASTRLGSAATSSYSPIVMRTNNDVIIQPGAVVIGDRPNENEVTLRFAENLPDDVYRLEIFGFDDPGQGIRGLRNTDGEFFVPSVANTRQDTIDFRLDLGAKITGVVPQPVVRNASGQLEQLRDTVIVYFDNDKLLVENDGAGNPTQRSVENPEFYQLIYTADTVRNTDDLASFLPVSVRYNASANTATLKFNDDIDRLAGPFAPASSFRLRVGTRESAPMAPSASESAATAIIDMNSNGAAKVRFTARQLGEAGSGTSVRFTNSNAGGLPTVSVAGNVITVDLRSATATVTQVIEALEASAAASLIRTSLEPGSNGNFVVGNRPINYSATLVGMGSTFQTSTNLGTIGSSSVPMTSLLMTSTIDAETHLLDLIGAANDPGQRVVPESFENHINPSFGGDDFPGIRTLFYNFRSNYGTVGGSPVTNAITEKQKERVREALSLWSNQLGVQFVETANSGLTFALGELAAASGFGMQVRQGPSFAVRIDPTYQNSLAVFSASNAWEDNYAEDFTRSVAASVGLMLGLSNAGNLDASNLMNFDTDFITFPPAGSNRNFEPIFPGNQDVLHGQYIHRPEGSDIDLYRFDIDFGPNGASRTGVFVAETFAERAASSSNLDTRLALYKEVQATALSTLNLGQSVQVKFTAVQSGKLGNNLQVFVTRSPRGVGASPLVQVFPNAIAIDLNSTVGSESTLGDFITALDNDPAARSLVKVELLAGSVSTLLGNRDITYSPITLKGGRVDLIAQNDNYFSDDSLIRLNLDSGVYYIGVSASGNDSYDPVIPGTGTGGRTQGKYDLRLSFRAQTDSADSIQDIAEANGISVALDGDADGTPGGVYNFWFETRQLNRSFNFNAGGSPALEGRLITLTGSNGVVRRFEFSADATVGTGNTRIVYSNSSSEADLAAAVVAAIQSRGELGITASAVGGTVTLQGERNLQLSPDLTVIDVLGKTIFVDKTAGPSADGSLAKPFNNIAGIGVPNAFGATFPGDIVRIVGNGGNDGRLETVNDNVAYEIGFGLLAGSILSDGPTMDVPRGVTVMVDAGAIFKSNRSRIGVGSSTLGVDRSGGALQVLGAPVLLDNAGNAIKLSNGTTAPGSVFFTSWLDESIGLDNYTPTTAPAPGNWGGLLFKRDLDKAAGRFDLEDEGIFLQYVNHADIRYGGSSSVVIDSVQQVVNSIQIADMRPTISYNRITNGADAALSATPDSFQETLFSEPIYQRKGSFTPDYDRVGPDIHNNTLVNNSINGMFIKVSTPAGGELKQLTVPGRFDDTDVTHVIAENILIQGRPGAGLLDATLVSSNLVSLQARTGGILLPGTYNYKITFVDRYGYETPPSDPTQSVVVAPGQSAVSVFGIPGVSGEYVTRRIYRSDSSGSGSYRLVAELDGGTTTFLDRGQQPADGAATLLRDRPNVSGVGLSTMPAGNLNASTTYTYRVVMVDAAGRESLASNATTTISTTAANRTIRLTNLPALQEGYATRRIYRSAPGGAGTFVLAGEITASGVTTFTDNGSVSGAPLSILAFGNVRPRLDASLAIDPGMIIKLEGTRIEIGHSAQLLAEGTVDGRVVFTSKQDDRFGAGGTFDTNNNGRNADNDANPRDWSGVYASPGSTLQLDNAVFAFAGGVSRIEGTLKAFSPIELQQADARIANTIFEENANGMGGQGPIDRLGRPANENYPFGNNASRGSTVFIRGTQPVMLNNVFQNNQGTAMTIDVNSMDAKLRGDSGRQSGQIDRDLTLDANRGPLFRGNKLFNNGINGLEIRADAATNNTDTTVLSVRDLPRNYLTTESVWDDTDIVHVLFDSVVVSNLEHSNGLRLQSAINESLVIKLEGQGSNFDKERGTGFTATGTYSSTPDRVGGTIQVIGQPGFPVVFTSLRDDSVGAGTQPDGRPQTDTNNDGIATVPRPGDWRSLVFDTFSNDRNVQTVMEVESPTTIAPGTNDSVTLSQFLGVLAPNAQASDENRILGFVVEGVISEPNDQDIFSFSATAGTEVWFDIDATSYTLDSVIEVLDANGALLARSDNSTDEQLNPSLIEVTSLVDSTSVNPIVKRNNTVSRRNESGLLKDDFTTNPKDAALRVLLPGINGTISTYFFRVRSKSTNIDNSAAGLTSGSYTVQVRLRDQQEFAGSIVSYADIRYATNGVHATGLPAHSPLTGEAHVNMFDGTNDGITEVGNLHYTDAGAISVAGQLTGGAPNLIRFTLGDTDLLQPSFGTTYPIAIDVDYADGLNRPNTSAYLFSNNGIYVGTSSSIADDLINPVRPLSGSEFADLTRGSVGSRDPYIGSIALPRGTYDLGISGDGGAPVALSRNTVLFDDSFENLFSNSRISNPVFPSFIDVARSNASFGSDADYKWRPATTNAGGHGGTQVFGWNPGDPKANTAVTPDALYSTAFTAPANWDAGDRVHFSMKYRYPTAPGGNLQVRLYNNAAGTGTPVYTSGLGSSDNLWRTLEADLSSVFASNPGATFVFEFSYRDANGAITGGPTGVQFDDFYLGIWTPRYTPVDTYRWIAHEGFDFNNQPGVSIPNLFPALPAAPGTNQWQTSFVGSNPNYSGARQLEFVSDGNVAQDLVTNTLDLSNEANGTRLYVTYDFVPHDANDRFEIYGRVAGQPDVLLASSLPGAAPVSLNRTLGQYDQARISLDRFEGGSVQLVFRYDSNGANAAGTGSTGYVRMDDVVIGMISRGEFATNTTSSRAFTAGGAGAGQYQVEIRKSDAVNSNAPKERYDRGSFSTSLMFMPGMVMPDKAVFTLSDGASRVNFQFTYDGQFDFGNTPIRVSATSTPAELAVAVRDAINTTYAQSRLRITAANSNGIISGSARGNTIVNLSGEVEFVSGASLFGNAIVNFNQFGDQNVPREQGQFVVTSTRVTEARDFGVLSAPADKYFADGRTLSTAYGAPPTLGGAYARNLPQENLVPFGVGAGSRAENAGLTPGMIVSNNIFDGNGLGGLHIQGDTPMWQITALPGAQDNVQTANTDGDHSGSFVDDGDILSISFGRQKVNFEFEDVAGAPTGAPNFGSGVVQGNGWFQDNIPIYYREDGGQAYLRPGNGVSGYSDDEVVKAIRDAINGSVLVTNLTTHNIRTWVAEQTTGSASIYVKGPQAITNRSVFGGSGPLSIQQVGEFTASPFVRAVNNTVFGNDGRAPFNASTTDTTANDTIAGAIETWQGIATNPVSYTVNATLNPDPLSTGSSDVDLYKFTLGIGERVLIDVDTLDTATLDAAVKIFDAQGRAMNVRGLIDPTTNDFGLGPGDTSVGRDPYVDFTATVPGVYYAAISSAGNTTYDPLSLAGRQRGSTSGDYTMTLQVLKAQQFVISVDDPSAYADGETFTIDQVADFGTTGSRSRTFEFTRTGAVTAGNIPVFIGADYRVPDVARAIAGAVNAAGMLNTQQLSNGDFGVANPLAPVSAVAVGGINGFQPNSRIPAGHGDVGVNSGNIRGPQVQAGLAIYPGWNSDESPFDVSPTHSSIGLGTDRSNSGQASSTSQGNGTTEKYVVIRNASTIRSNGNIKVDPDFDANNNLNQIISETGILVTGGASPTLLNNAFVNVQTPIVQEEARLINGFLAQQNGRPVTSMTNGRFGTGPNSPVRPSPTIVSGTISQYWETAESLAALNVGVEAGPINVPNTSLDFNTTIPNNVRAFVDAPGGRFLPAPGSPVIDSSVDSLPEREAFRAVKSAVGISPSPVLAPDRDHSGQLRADDPAVSPPSGLGGNVFKDRGALDRADFVGPTAVALTPIDNDAQGIDIDNTLSVMRLEDGVYREFRIQLKDGFETANLQAGTGINDDSVIGREGGNRLPGSVITLTENGRLLVEGIDYAFAYNSTTNEIVLKPLAGIWRNDRVYDISLNNKDRFVIDASSGDIVDDGDTFTIRDTLGGTVYFEYDSGFRLQVPQGIQLQVPIAGGGAGGIGDGDSFIVNDRTQSYVFEFDSNNNSIAGNTRIPFSSLSTKRNIADAIVAALSTIPTISVRVLDNDDVFIGAPLGGYVDTTDTPALPQPNSTLALLVPALGTRPGGITDGQTFGVSDGRTSLIFEFDSDRNTAPGNVRIDISAASTPSDVSAALKLALDGSGLGVNATIVDSDKVHLSLPIAGRIDVVNTNLKRVGVARSLVDGQSITITRDLGTSIETSVFEFTFDGNVQPGNLPVLITSADTQSDIGTKLALAIRDANIGLQPRHVGDGNIFIGGTEAYTISVTNAPTVGLFGRPGIQDNTTLDIFGTLLLQIPTRGGVDIADNSTFTISANNRSVVFEFDSNFSGPSLPGNVVIRYGAASTAADLVTTILPIIANAGLGINPRDAGGGRIDVGLLPNNSVNVSDSGITLSRGNVSDGDVFIVNNGTVAVSFEFENLSIGNGRNPANTPIRYNNQSSRADVFAAMKAAIESSILGLQTEITPNGLKLLDNARYTTNIDNAPSLQISGVPGGAVPVSFVQDLSFSATDMRDAIVRAINQANADGRTNLFAKVRGGSTLFVEEAVNISTDVANFYLRGIQDNSGNFLRSNRINNETQFTILMPGTLLDFGDAPDPITTTPGRYPTLLAFDGARHVSNATALRLGADIDSELDGRSSPLSDGDAGDDGVAFQFQNLARPIFNHTIDTGVTITLTTNGFVDGWIDFNGDGDWDDPGEHIVRNVEFSGTNLTQTFQIRVPATSPIPASGINSYARFRTSSAGNHLPTGLALDGEVEDYLVRIIPGVPPVGNSDVYTMDEDQVGGLVTIDANGQLTPGFVVDDGVLANDTSADGRVISGRLISGPQHSSVPFTLGSNGLFTYVPNPDFFGTDTFVYRSFVTIDAGLGEIIEATTDTTVTINVRPVNDTPLAVDFSRTINEDQPLRLTTDEVVTLSGAVAGPANESAQTLRLSVPNNVSAQNGSLSVVGGVLTYTPPLNFAGTDTFTFTITDDGVTGTLADPRSVTRTATITVRDKNDPPVTVPKSVLIDEDTQYTNGIAFFTNGDTAGEPGQTLTFTGVEPVSSQGGTVVFENGVVRYTPRADFNGTDTFFYLVTDNGTSEGVLDPQTSRGTVTVTVTAVNDAPRVVAPMGTLTLSEDDPEVSLNLTQYFFDPDVLPNGDEIQYRVVSNTNNNLVQINFVGNTMFVRPLADANGNATVVVEARDVSGALVTNTLNIVVNPVGDAPRLATPLPNLNVSEDQAISPITLSPTYFFDPDSLLNGDQLTFTVDVNNTDLVSASIINGSLSLVLLPDASGIATVTVRATDLAGNTISDSFDLVVAATNDGPRAVNDSYTVPRGAAFTTTDPTGNLTSSLNDDGVLANDRDPEGNAFTARVTRQPAFGTLSFNPDGTFTYRSNNTISVGSTDTFEYEGVDQFGAVGSRGTVTITIGNPPPPLHQNQSNRLDVNADGSVSPLDVLIIVNFLNFAGASSIPVAGLEAPPPYRDVNGDNFISPLDVLEVINFINARSNQSGEGEGEGSGSMMVGVGLDGAARVAWSSSVTQTSSNQSVGMSDVRVAGARRDGENTSMGMSLADYWASLSNEEEEDIATVLFDSSDPDIDSLDGFFAEAFNG
ncbi:tandem-95 repeat protein [Pirellulaceae bacterium SH467]